MPHKLLLLTKDNEQYIELLENCSLPDLILLNDEPKNIKDADIWLADPILAAPIIGHANHLKWLQSTYSGVAPLVKPRLRKDYQLTNIKGIFGPVMSEFVFSNLLTHRNKKNDKIKKQNNLWLPESYKTLQGKCLLLLGTGSIAKHIAHTAKQFNMIVLGINKYGELLDDFDYISSLTDLSDFISKADAIVNLLPSNIDTQGILNKNVLIKIKPNAILFNLGLEDILDLHSLNLQLKNKPDQQAIIDVFNQEPLSNKHPIRQRTNVTITPHIPSPSFPEQVMEIFSHNYQRYIEGKPLNNQICFQQGY